MSGTRPPRERGKLTMITQRIVSALVVAAVAILAVVIYGPSRQDVDIRLSPEPIESLRGVQLGMTVEDVTLVFGDKPSSVEPHLAVWDIPAGFFTVTLADARVTEVCLSGSESSVVTAFQNGMTLYYVGASTDILDSLGDEFYTSINADSTMQIRTWTKRHVAFESQGTRITAACLTRRPLRYSHESRFIGAKELSGRFEAPEVEGYATKVDYCYDSATQQWKKGSTCSSPAEPAGTSHDKVEETER